MTTCKIEGCGQPAKKRSNGNFHQYCGHHLYEICYKKPPKVRQESTIDDDRICEIEGCGQPAKKRSNGNKPHKYCGQHLYEKFPPSESKKLKRFGREWYKLQKVEVLTHYSNGIPKCNCCGETQIDFLVLDHVNNDGATHRKSKKKGGTHFYLTLKRENYPNEPKLQVLCANCNQGKLVNGGICPHQIKQIVSDSAVF